jgi:hypothetical protein
MSQPDEPSPADERPPFVLRCAGVTAEWVLKPVVHAVVVLAALGVLSPSIVVGISRVAPSCSDHPGFAPIDMAALLIDEGRSVKVTPEASDSAPDPRLDGRRLFDRRVSTGWTWPVPDMAGSTTKQFLDAAAGEDEEGIATLHVSGDFHNVQLVCLVNGAPIDPASYVRADRAEIVEVRVDCADRPITVRLRSQPDSDIYSAQKVPIRCRNFTSFDLAVRSTYPGQWIEEPSNGQRVGPTHLGAIAELTFYTPVGASHADYSRTAAVINWMYVNPGKTALWSACILATLIAVFGVAELSGRRPAREPAKRAADRSDTGDG